MIEESNLALLLSAAYTAPYVDVHSVAMLTTEEVFKLVKMYNEEVLEYVRTNKMKTVPLKNIVEEAYVLCDGVLIDVGLFEGGYIPSDHLLKYRHFCDEVVGMHTHPVPLPIPTPEDLISMKQVGYNVECVLSRTEDSKATMICVEPIDDFKNILNSIAMFSKNVYSLVDRYIVVEDELGVLFLPYPSPKSLQKIVEEFTITMKNVCKICIARFDMDKNEYDVIITP
jgi:proteasome lid subunit RPN8/RPN11